jgi:hypothetical protein
LVTVASGKAILCPNEKLVITNYTSSLSYQWQLNGSVITGQTGNEYQVLANEGGNYTVHVLNSATGCENGSDALTVQVHSVVTPVIYEKKDQNVLSLLIVDNSANTFTDYKWFYADDSSLPAGIIDSRQFITLTGAYLNEQFKVRITDKNGCQAESGTASVTVNSASAVVYPTANNGSFKVNLVYPSNGPVTVKIYNQSGITVGLYQFNKSLQAETFNINMGAVISGSYMVEVSIEGYKEVKWIVKN